MRISKNAPVSVVIPCYRCTETIERAVSSIACQTILPYEVILVEDASDDESLKLLYGIKSQYDGWIRIVALSKNSGAASARNIGWNLATQPYIAFLDADDAWHPQKLEIQYGYMRNNPDVILSGHLCKELSKFTPTIPDWFVELKVVKKISWLRILLSNQFVTPSIMLKNNISLRFSEGKRFMEDQLLWLEIVNMKMPVVKLCIELVAVYKPMYGDSGLSSNLWLMEEAELSNYKYLYNQGKIIFYQYIFLQLYSIIKFIRRLLIVHVKRRFLGS